MIVSINKEESQIWPPYDINIVFDGVLQRNCVYADDEKGMIKNTYVNEIWEIIETVELEGDVQIIHKLADNE